MKRKFPDKRTIILITGGPGTGKSRTAARLLSYLNNEDIESISYDEIKEKNWDRFGFDNLKQKDRLNAWSLQEFYLTIQKAMWENQTILIEYPFYQRHKKRLAELIDESHYQAVTICLYTDYRTMYKRGCRRDQESGRHPGHLLECYHKETYKPDQLDSKSRIALSYEEFKAGIIEKDYDIALGLNLRIDVTNSFDIDFADLYKQIVDYESKGRH